MADNKNYRYLKDLDNEIEAQRAIIKNKYKNYDSLNEKATYDYGFLDGTLAGLKLARSIWYKNNPEIKE